MARMAFRCPEHDRCVVTFLMEPGESPLKEMTLPQPYAAILSRFEGEKAIAYRHTLTEEGDFDVQSVRLHLEERVARLETVNNMTWRGRRRMQKVKAHG